MDLMTRYPDVAFILTKVGVGKHHILYPMLSQHRNLFIDTSLYRDYRGVEALAQHAGADHLVFGTAMPLLDARFSLLLPL